MSNQQFHQKIRQSTDFHKFCQINGKIEEAMEIAQNPTFIRGQAYRLESDILPLIVLDFHSPLRANYLKKS